MQRHETSAHEGCYKEQGNVLCVGNLCLSQSDYRETRPTLDSRVTKRHRTDGTSEKISVTSLARRSNAAGNGRAAFGSGQPMAMFRRSMT